MRSPFLPKAAVAVVILFAAFTIGISQEKREQNALPVEQNEMMTENDRLPFMQTEEIAQTAEPSSGGMLIKTLGSMLLIVGILFFGAWGIKKFGLFGVRNGDAENSPELKISSTVSVANGQMLSVVRFGDRVLLVGSTPQSFTLLADEYGGAVPESNIAQKSVSELLAEENLNFGKELQIAQNRYSQANEIGGKL
jgi:flagellar biogenesis protein FliO